MTRDEAKELKDKIYNVDFDYEGDDLIDKIYDDFENEIKEKTKWHKIEDGDLPKEDGNYLLVMKMKYATKEGTSRPYMNVSQFSMKDGWKDPYGEDFAKETIFVAWRELPKYEEE